MTKIKTRKTTKECVDIHVEVTMGYVTEAATGGGCRDPGKCMERLAIFAALEDAFGAGSVKRLVIDAGQVKTTLMTADGLYRWHGPTPKSAKNNLIKFDAWTTKLKRNPESPCPIQPHAYKVTLEKGTKVQPHSPERRKKINKARAARKEAGVPDKKYTKLTTHDRVVGLASI